MCAEAIFSDQSGDAGGQFMRAAEFGQNFMQRRQRQQWEQEDRTENQRVRTLFEPVMQAQRQAQIATALSSLETNKQQQQLRTRFAAEAPAFNAKYQEAMKLPTFADQQAALAQLQPQVAWMGLIPEGKGFVDVVNNSRATAFQSQLADQRIKGEIDKVTAQTAGDQAEILLRGEQARDTARVVGEQQRTTNAARPRATNPAQRDAERIRFLQEQADAIRELDPETAALFEQRAQYIANPAGAGGGGDLFESWAGGAPATTATPAPAARPSVTPSPAAPVTTQTVIDSIKF